MEKSAVILSYSGFLFTGVSENLYPFGTVGRPEVCLPFVRLLLLFSLLFHVHGFVFKNINRDTILLFIPVLFGLLG